MSASSRSAMMNNWFISVNPSQFGELKVWFAPTPPNLRLQSTVAGLYQTSSNYIGWLVIYDFFSFKNLIILLDRIWINSNIFSYRS